MKDKLTHEKVDEIVEGMLSPQKDSPSNVFKKMLERFQKNRLTQGITLPPTNGETEAS